MIARNRDDTSGVPAQRLLLAVVALLALLLPGAGLGAAPDEAAVADGLYARANALRKEAGVPPVSAEPHLEAAAREFARYMARTGRYGHEADGRKPAERARAHGYAYCIVSENIAYEYSSAGYTTSGLVQGFASGWAQSPPHRKNLLDPAVVDTGAAVAHSERDGRYYAVQMFGLPTSRMAKFSIANESPATVRYRIEGRRYSLAPRATATHSRCRPGPVTFEWPGGQHAARIRPEDGARYVVFRDGSGKWAVQRRRVNGR